MPGLRIHRWRLRTLLLVVTAAGGLLAIRTYNVQQHFRAVAAIERLPHVTLADLSIDYVGPEWMWNWLEQWDFCERLPQWIRLEGYSQAFISSPGVDETTGILLSQLRGLNGINVRNEISRDFKGLAITAATAPYLDVRGPWIDQECVDRCLDLSRDGMEVLLIVDDTSQLEADTVRWLINQNHSGLYFGYTTDISGVLPSK